MVVVLWWWCCGGGAVAVVLWLWWWCCGGGAVAVVVVLWWWKPEGRGSIPGWAASSFTLVSHWKNRLGRMKKVWLFSNWDGRVMVKAVVYEAQRGEDRFVAGPRALLSWFHVAMYILSCVLMFTCTYICL